ncbi:uncharacterized protein LOC114751475 [Neltuma alba]|uniref:uncharacterized protein LOC114736515 n=1 Tax=Neltuma alba TaxID=207710 RepID=UPI0010A32295|nr:uncharacterized protein LOC114736515 [Prosopis alba]XP_028795983.1 uncharacterized protein LOC114751475 [Prosopis alba]
MELHSATAAKRLWNVLRISFLMMRKGLISKRKLIMDMNVMMKKGKLLRKSLSNLMSSHHHHHHHSKSMTRGGFGMQEYEFSCSNSPNPAFLYLHKRKHHFNFPCINHPQVIDEEPDLEPPKATVLMPKTPEYSFNLRFDPSDFAAGDRRSPLLSPFSVRISNFSSVDELEEPGNGLVDDQAEDFITRFYEQLRMQSRTQLLEYPDMYTQDI